MAIKQEITDRYKAEGFYKYVEWNRKRGVLIKLFHQQPSDKVLTVSFESGTFDDEYEQMFQTHRQFFTTRSKAVKFMLNLGMAVPEIASVFKMIDGMQVVTKHIKASI